MMEERPVMMGFFTAIICLGFAALVVLRGNSWIPSVGAAHVRKAKDDARRIKPLHQVKGRPRPGDWLAAHRESGQTFAQYVQSKPNRPTKLRSTIYILPLGEFSEPQKSLIRDTAEVMRLFYRAPVKVLPAVSLDQLPQRARRVHPQWGDKQLLTTYLLYDVLRKRRPQDAVAVLGLTTSDLWPGEGWNFVFGQADLTQRVGVWSTYRNGDPKQEYTLCLRRTLRTALHETGHMLGIKHCIAYECMMNGSNNRSESDRQPLYFCPECVQKVWWACGAATTERYDQLADFAEQHDLTGEAEFWRRSSAALKAQ